MKSNTESVDLIKMQVIKIYVIYNFIKGYVYNFEVALDVFFVIKENLVCHVSSMFVLEFQGKLFWNFI